MATDKVLKYKLRVEKSGTIYSKSVIKAISKDYSEYIRESAIGSKEMRDMINATLQQANRRIQNLQSGGYLSPALEALKIERGDLTRYSVFSIGGLKIDNPTDWEQAKREYGRAISFLNNPTSTAQGARQWLDYNATNLGISKEQASRIMTLALDREIDAYGNVGIWGYKSILENLRNDARQSEWIDNMNADEYAELLERRLQEQIAKSTNNRMDFLDRYIDNKLGM